MQAEGFPPVVAGSPRLLVLGSLPGAMSLARREYYAQPRNGFWPIMGRLVGAAPELPYAERLARLTASGIALWDVCASGFRPGSLDAAIVPASVVPNDFSSFLRAHPGIGLICFNGAKAAELFARHVLPGLPPQLRDTARRVLPSTSPAHAAMRFEEKLRRWEEALGVRPRSATAPAPPCRS
jgi:double-stranded uracil-DNA glycosylase